MRIHLGNNMNITIKKLPASKVEIGVILPWAEWKEELHHAAEHLAKDLKIAGFRPGKAPRDVIEKRFGKPALLVEAAEHAVQHSYPLALKQEKVDAIGKPEVTLGKLAEDEPLEYSVVTAVLPEVTLKPWKDAVQRVNKEYAQKTDVVDEAEISTELDRLAETRATLVTVNREAKTGDSVLVDFSVLQDGVLIENGKSEKHPLVLGKGVFIPGFEEELLGMRAGDEKVFELTFPPEYHVKHLAGKPATFQVKMGVVQERAVPVIDDAFAMGLGNFASLEKLKETMREGLLEEKKVKNKEERRGRLLDVLVEHSAIEHPEILIEEELSRMVREFEMQVRSMGLDFSEYLVSVKKTEEEMKKEWLPQAKKRLSAHMILERLAKEEEMAVENEAVEAEMNKTLAQYKNTKDVEKKIDMERLYVATRGQLLNEKVFEFLEKL